MLEFFKEINKGNASSENKKESFDSYIFENEDMLKIKNDSRAIGNDTPDVKKINTFTIFLNDTVTVDSVNEAIKLLNEAIKEALFLKETSGNEIKIILLLNTPGGSVIQGFRLVDFIKNSPIPIVTIANGLVASMGIPILISGKERYATKNSILMIHQLSSGAFGKLSELEDYMKLWKDLQKKLHKFILDHTEITKEELDKLMQRESFLTVEEGLKYKIIDDVWTKII